MLTSCDEVKILSDPWYSGDAFHKGWNLLYENPEKDVDEILNRTTHIWISHEHPDHFSVKFFKVFKNQIKEKNIKILFQRTRDKRVVKFFSANNFPYQELDFGVPVALSKNVSVICIKDGFYDSGLLIKNRNEKILNLNDCEITSPARATEVKRIVGDVDVLLTQFSFAAWKGGVDNVRWRRDAASEKLATMQLQIQTFNPKFVVPFASFVRFSNERNSYLNDAVNTPNDLIEKFQDDGSFRLCIMKPLDVLHSDWNAANNKISAKFWEEQYSKKVELNRYSVIDEDQLEEAFNEYTERIYHNNNSILMRLLRLLSPIKVFQSTEVFLDDKNKSVSFDYLKRTIVFSQKRRPDLVMSSESLLFLFKNNFGFDTLTVNGCFEEGGPGGFVKATKSLAIENLNNLGIRIRLTTLFNFAIAKLFLTRLYRVARKLED